MTYWVQFPLGQPNRKCETLEEAHDILMTQDEGEVTRRMLMVRDGNDELSYEDWMRLSEIHELWYREKYGEPA